MSGYGYLYTEYRILRGDSEYSVMYDRAVKFAISLMTEMHTSFEASVALTGQFYDVKGHIGKLDNLSKEQIHGLLDAMNHLNTYYENCHFQLEFDSDSTWIRMGIVWL